MKSLFVALVVGVSFLSPLHASAQTAPENAAPASVPTKDDAFSQAVKAVQTFEWKKPYPQGAELLRLERENVATNAEALRQIRAVLADENVYKMAPPRIFYELKVEPEDAIAEMQFDIFAKSRKSARLFVRESNVRLADGDAVGAMNSRVDALRLGAAVTARGHYISSLVGIAISAIALRDVEKIIAQLDGPSALAAFETIETARKLQPTRTQILENERDSGILQARLTLSMVEAMRNSPDAAKVLGQMSRKERQQVEKLTEETVTQNYRRLFAAVIAQSEKPYSQWQKIHVPDLDNITLLIQPLFDSQNAFFQFARSQTQIALAQAALLRRARDANTISTTEFENLLPLDPFGEGKLQVRDHRFHNQTIWIKNTTRLVTLVMRGEKIYSIGPDGKDDGGKAFEPQRFDFDPASGRFVKLKNPRTSLQINSRGDVLAPGSVNSPR